jgi:nucleoredoxin
LYFASSWCPDCVASKPYVSSIFKTQQQQDNNNKLFDLVYISSDNNSNEMEGEMEDGWNTIPFTKIKERSDLKIYFGICAGKEMENLGISNEQRKGGIPTLILIQKENCTVLSLDAIPNIMGDAKIDDPLTHWKSLLLQSSNNK